MYKGVGVAVFKIHVITSNVKFTLMHYVANINIFNMNKFSINFIINTINTTHKHAIMIYQSGINYICKFEGYRSLYIIYFTFLGLEQVALLLIDRGCDVHLHDMNSVSPFEECQRKNFTKVNNRI